MHDFAVLVLLGLALFKLVDVIEDVAPRLTAFHSLLLVGLGVAGASFIDYSLFDAYGIGLRERWMGVVLTGLIMAGTTSMWRAAFHWLGSSEGDEPARRHTEGNRPRIAA